MKPLRSERSSKQIVALFIGGKSMTTRTCRHFTCTNGHKGEEKISENDQPYSQHWEAVSVQGVSRAGTDEKGFAKYICNTCKQAMILD